VCIEEAINFSLGISIVVNSSKDEMVSNGHFMFGLWGKLYLISYLLMA